MGCGCGDVGGVRFEASDAGRLLFCFKVRRFSLWERGEGKKRRVIGGCLPGLGGWMRIRGGICLKTVKGRSKWVW